MLPISLRDISLVNLLPIEMHGRIRRDGSVDQNHSCCTAADIVKVFVTDFSGIIRWLCTNGRLDPKCAETQLFAYLTRLI